MERVEFMPKELRPGILYVSEEYRTAAHLCACGCGAKVRTPLGPMEWTVEETSSGPTVSPSVGNWQRCGKHYLIVGGEVRWAGAWSQEAILAGRRREEESRATFFEGRQENVGVFRRAWNWIRGLFGK